MLSSDVYALQVPTWDATPLQYPDAAPRLQLPMLAVILPLPAMQERRLLPDASIPSPIFFLMIRPPPRSTLFPYPTPFRSIPMLRCSPYALPVPTWDATPLQYPDAAPPQHPPLLTEILPLPAMQERRLLPDASIPSPILIPPPTTATTHRPAPRHSPGR